MKKFLALLGIACAAAAGAYWHFAQPGGPLLTEAKLTFVAVQRATLRDVVSATGIVETHDLLVVGSELPGTVVRLLAKVNDPVVDGQELASLDDRRFALKVEEADNGKRTADAALAQAEAAKLAADIALKTQLDLEKSGGFRTERDQSAALVKAAQAGILVAEARVKTAETAQKEAKLALDMTRIRVPASPLGKRSFRVLERKVHEGQTVGPSGGPLFVLAGELTRVEVHTQVAEGDIGKVRVGLPATFALTGYSEEDVEFRGTVREIRPLATNVKGAVFYDAVVEIVNEKDPKSGEWRLRPGMTASVDLVRAEHKNVWRAPSAALNFTLDEAYHSDAARDRLARWRLRPDAARWATLWTWDASRQAAWPRFVRLLGANAAGEPGLKDSEGSEILEWDDDGAPRGDEPFRAITGAPPARAKSLFDRPANLKIS